MKRKSIIFAALVLIPSIYACKTSAAKKAAGSQAEVIIDEHSSMTALDWDGLYTGILPRSEGEGIYTAIRLNKDLTYTKSQRYHGDQKLPPRVTQTNKFSWDKTGQIIALGGYDETRYATKYFVGENVLIQLDLKGDRISGDLASSYELQKVESGITNRYWELIELKGIAVKKDNDAFNKAHMFLKREDEHRVQGNGGCNNFGGSFELMPGDRIKFGAIGATKMACMSERITDQESLFFRALELADSYTLTGDTLQLNKARMAPLAKFVTDNLK